MNNNKILSRLTLALIVAEVAVLLLSWILSATMTPGVRSLLSSEGVRWLVGSFAEVVASWPLAWIVLLSISWGCLRRSGLLHFRRTFGRERAALWLVVFEAVVALLLIALLTLTPHAPLLSITGRLFPSPFSAGLVPMLALFIAVVSVSFGALVGRFRSFFDVFQSMSEGLSFAAPLMVVYIFVVWLAATFDYAFMNN